MFFCFEGKKVNFLQIFFVQKWVKEKKKRSNFYFSHLLFLLTIMMLFLFFFQNVPLIIGKRFFLFDLFDESVWLCQVFFLLVHQNACYHYFTFLKTSLQLHFLKINQQQKFSMVDLASTINYCSFFLNFSLLNIFSCW